MSPSPREAFAFAFKWWLFILITVLVPLDFLYSWGSLVTAPPLQLGIYLSSTVILLAILALTIASISTLLTLCFNKLSTYNPEFLNKANAISGLLFTIIIFSDYLLLWTRIVFNISYMNTNTILRLLINILYLLILIISIIILYIKNNKIYYRIKLTSESFYKINIYSVILCTMFLLFYLPYSFYKDYGKDKTFATINKMDNLSEPDCNIVLITFDALANQQTSLYGYHRKTTPELDRLGQKSYVFDYMYSSSNWTRPSLYSLMTGKHPYNSSGNALIGYTVWPKNQNLPFLLKELGYETAMVWSNDYSCPWIGNLTSFDNIAPNNRHLLNMLFCKLGLGPNPWLLSIIEGNRIYRVITDLINVIYKQSDDIDPILRPEYSFSKALELLSYLKKPFFLWIHIYPPHAPYLPKDGFLYSILKDKIFDSYKDYLNSKSWYPLKDQPKIDQLAMRYDENIRYVDYEFGNFLSMLTKRGLFDNSILIVSADHGQMFERGFWSHGGPYLYQPVIHVPLIIHLPGQTQGQRINANVSHVDIAPTVLDLLGINPPNWMEGKSFKQAMYGNNLDTDTKFSIKMDFVNCRPNHKIQSIAAIKGNYKLIKYLELNQYEMYDVRNDSKEQINLISSKPEIFSSLKGEIERILKR